MDYLLCCCVLQIEASGASPRNLKVLKLSFNKLEYSLLIILLLF